MSEPVEVQFDVCLLSSHTGTETVEPVLNDLREAMERSGLCFSRVVPRPDNSRALSFFATRRIKQEDHEHAFAQVEGTYPDVRIIYYQRPLTL